MLTTSRFKQWLGSIGECSRQACSLDMKEIKDYGFQPNQA
jgi:hypothetical protein